NQREYERRMLIDTYKTFGCEPGHPTFSYDLESGSNDGFLIKPTLVDARTEVTTQLLSDDGYSVRIADDSGSEVETTFRQRDFERKVFNDETNVAMCKALIDNGLYDPIAKGRIKFGLGQMLRQTGNSLTAATPQMSWAISQRSIMTWKWVCGGQPTFTSSVPIVAIC
ncbi:MAG: hypothetical protein RL289_521, partial [Actinomycetota bacterium]